MEALGVGIPYYKLPESEVSQSCPTLCDPMDCSLSGSSIHGILQAGILECDSVFLRSLLKKDFESGAKFTIFLLLHLGEFAI